MSLKRARSESKEASTATSDNSGEDDFKDTKSDKRQTKSFVKVIRETKRTKGNLSSSESDREENIIDSKFQINQRVKLEDVEKVLYDSDEHNEVPQPKSRAGIKKPEGAGHETGSDSSERSKNVSPGKPGNKGLSEMKETDIQLKLEASSNSDSDGENLPLLNVKTEEGKDKKKSAYLVQVKSPPGSTSSSDSDDDTPLNKISKKQVSSPSGTKSRTAVCAKKVRQSDSDCTSDSALSDGGDCKERRMKPRSNSSSSIEEALNKHRKCVLPKRKGKTTSTSGKALRNEKMPDNLNKRGNINKKSKGKKSAESSAEMDDNSESGSDVDSDEPLSDVKKKSSELKGIKSKEKIVRSHGSTGLKLKKKFESSSSGCDMSEKGSSDEASDSSYNESKKKKVKELKAVDAQDKRKKSVKREDTISVKGDSKLGEDRDNSMNEGSDPISRKKKMGKESQITPVDSSKTPKRERKKVIKTNESSSESDEESEKGASEEQMEISPDKKIKSRKSNGGMGSSSKNTSISDKSLKGKKKNINSSGSESEIYDSEKDFVDSSKDKSSKPESKMKAGPKKGANASTNDTSKKPVKVKSKASSESDDPAGSDHREKDEVSSSDERRKKSKLLKNKKGEKSKKTTNTSEKSKEMPMNSVGKKNVGSDSERDGKSDEEKSDEDGSSSSDGKRGESGDWKNRIGDKNDKTSASANKTSKDQGRISVKKEKSSSSSESNGEKESDASSGPREKGASVDPKIKRPPAGEKKIARMKKFILLAGIRINNYNSFWSGCKSATARVKKMQDLLEEKGLSGRPTIEKCKKLRKKLERQREIAELDLGNIIGGETRSRRGASVRNQETKVFKKELEVIKKEPDDEVVDFKKRFSRIRDIVSSESD